MNLYLDIDETLIDEYDEDTNPGGVRRVLEDAGYYLRSAIALWDLLGVTDKSSELAVLLRMLFNVYRVEELSPCWLETDELFRLEYLLEGLVEAAERELVDENWRAHSIWIAEIERRHPRLGYFTTDGNGERIYSLSKCLSEVHLTLMYVRKAIGLGCNVLVE
jgi:hypothetical protein